MTAVLTTWSRGAAARLMLQTILLSGGALISSCATEGSVTSDSLVANAITIARATVAWWVHHKPRRGEKARPVWRR